MHRRRVENLHGLRAIVALYAPLNKGGRCRGRGRTESTQLLTIRGGNKRFVCSIQRHHAQGAATVDHQPGRFRIHPNVEFSQRRAVANVMRPAHNHQFGDLRRHFWAVAQHHRHIGERPHGHQRNIAS